MIKLVKIIPEQTLTNIAQAPKGMFTFKTNARNQFYPYEILNYTENHTVILPFKRTATGTDILLSQHGFNLKNIHYIDILAKHIGSPLEHKNTKYLQKTTLSEIHDAIEETMEKLGPGPKNLILSDFHSIAPHHGTLKTQRFIDYLSKRMESKMTKTIVLVNHRALPMEISKYLFTHSEKIIEIPK